MISPSDDERNVTIKVGNYLAVGTVVWVVRPDTKTVEVYAPGKSVQVLSVKDMLSGGEILPGFTLAVEKIFPKEEQ